VNGTCYRGAFLVGIQMIGKVTVWQRFKIVMLKLRH